MQLPLQCVSGVNAFIAIAIAVIVAVNLLVIAQSSWDGDEEDIYSDEKATITGVAASIASDMNMLSLESRAMASIVQSASASLDLGTTKLSPFYALNETLLYAGCPRVMNPNTAVIGVGMRLLRPNYTNYLDEGIWICLQNSPGPLLQFPNLGPQAVRAQLCGFANGAVSWGTFLGNTYTDKTQNPNFTVPSFSHSAYSLLGQTFFYIASRTYFVVQGYEAFGLAYGYSIGWQEMFRTIAGDSILMLTDERYLPIATSYQPELARSSACIANATAFAVNTAPCIDISTRTHPLQFMREFYANVLMGMAPIAAESPKTGKVTLLGTKYQVSTQLIFNGTGMQLYFSCLRRASTKSNAATVYALFVVVLVSAVIISCYSSFSTNRWFLKPVREIIDTMDCVTMLEFDFLSEQRLMRDVANAAQATGGDDGSVVAQANAALESKHVFSEMHELQSGFDEMAFSIEHFSRYIPKEVVKEQLLMGVTSSATAMASRVLTIVFIDIANFTTMCESLQTSDLVVLAEKYFDTITRTLMAHGCTIDKYIGDAVMGFWGAPLDFASQGYSACCAALHLMTAITDAQTAFMEYGMMLAVRVGVHRGTAVVGNIGCSERVSYTALGDTVNVASRLEGLNKLFHTTIAVSETVVLDALVDKEPVFCTRRLGTVKVKGRQTSVAVFQLIGVLRRAVPKLKDRPKRAGEGASSLGTSDRDSGVKDAMSESIGSSATSAAAYNHRGQSGTTTSQQRLPRLIWRKK